MNAAHLHLALNHTPVILVPLAVVVLLWGLLSRRDDVLRVGLAVSLAAGLLVIPVYLTGEGAEHAVENLPGVSEQVIDHHQDWALPAAIVTGVAGFLGLVGLGLVGRRRALAVATLVVSLAASGVVAYTAYAGGLIRHPEISPSFTPPPGARDEGGGEREGGRES